MTIKAHLLCFLLILSTTAFAQKEAAFWYFGANAGLDFNTGNPVALTNGVLDTKEGCATISDKNGKLLFYTDGSQVYDKTHQLMPNGSGLLGHQSSTQSAIIVPKPNNPNIYYIFTVDQPLQVNADDNPLNDDDAPNNGLNYSQVDLRLNNGLGDITITEKNIHLITYDQSNSLETKFKCSEKITAVQHGDGVSFWVVTHFINNFYAFKVSTQGVNKNPIISNTPLNIPIGGYHYNAIGYLKTSPNGKKIAIANSSTRSTDELGPKGNVINDTGNVLLYDFDADTGKTSNEITLMSGENPYGLEFSARTKKLYVTTNKYDFDGNFKGSNLLQYDLKSTNIAGSKTIVNSSLNNAGSLQLAPDEKIYRAGYSSSLIGTDGSKKLSVIQNPELDGTNCNFIQNFIDLKTGVAKLGLPPFITSLFLYSFNYEFNCLGQNTHFYNNTAEIIDAALWDFGDGSTSTDIDAYHTYAKAGNYKVTLIKTVNNEIKEPLEKTIFIYENPKIVPNYKLIQCDTNDTIPTDGLSTFNLSLANTPLCLGITDYQVHYYHSVIDAGNDHNNSLSIPEIYRNTTPDEVIYAKVSQPNSDCYTIGTVILHANKNITLVPESYKECDLGNGMANFNLDQKKIAIKQELNLPSDVVVFFYSKEVDAAMNINEIKGLYKTYPITLYIRAENNEGCYGTGQFDLVVEPTPKITPNETKILCEGSTNTSPTIVLEPGTLYPSITSDFTYLWSTNEISPTITVDKEGVYNVIVKNNYGCTATHISNVILSRLAKVNNILIKDLQDENQITVDVQNPKNYQFMITYENGIVTPFQKSNYFGNVPGGYHELTIENLDGCGQVKKYITILDAPIFFTPNNDGINDYWNLKGINSSVYKNTLINIYNRYGLLLKQLVPSNQGWDGNFNGNPMPSSDYWYTVKLEDGREAKGHFSLKR